jgi:hypothetical protein
MELIAEIPKTKSQTPSKSKTALCAEIPNPKLQIPEKFQIQSERCVGLQSQLGRFDIRSELGIWSFRASARLYLLVPIPIERRERSFVLV